MPPRRNGSTALAERPTSQEALENLEKVVITGDLSTLTPAERIGYYARVTQSLGLNPLTRPFEYLTLNNRLVLYARKDASDQLRKVNGISVDKVERERDDTLGLAIVTVTGHDKTGRTDSAIGAVSIAGLKGEAMANALMKAETKGKRRMTLSLAGLGWLDESEIETSQAVLDPVTAQERVEKVASRAEALEQAANQQPAGSGQEVTRPAGTVLDVDDIPFEQAPPAQDATAHWMRAIHAAGAERGLDHDRLHNWAVAIWPVESLNDLNADQQELFLATVKGLAADGGCSHPRRKHKATPAGVVCTACGALLASRGAPSEQPGQGRGAAALEDTPGPVSQPEGAAAAPPASAPASEVVPPGLASPATSLEEATQAVAEAAANHGVTTWERIDTIAAKATGKPADALTTDEWVAFGAELAAGVHDELIASLPQPRTRKAPVVTA